MNIKTKYGGQISETELVEYFKTLTNDIWKCLPMFESNTSTLSVHIETLLIEIGGANRTIVLDNQIFLKLIANLEPLLIITEHKKYKRQVLKCTNLCSKMIEKIIEENGVDLNGL
jgi:hypothetical protein